MQTTLSGWMLSKKEDTSPSPQRKTEVGAKRKTPEQEAHSTPEKAKQEDAHETEKAEAKEKEKEEAEGEGETTNTLAIQPSPHKKPKAEDTTLTGSSSPAARSFLRLFSANPQQRNRLDKSFYERDIVALSKALLGQILVRRVTIDGVVRRLAGRIVEVEAYCGGDDKGAHSYGGKVTKKNKSMFMPPGTAYIYRIYRIHHCFNISSEGEGAATLVRALEPMEGLTWMRKHRQSANGAKAGTPMKDTNLCSGPGKICQAMLLDLAYDGVDLPTHEDLFLEEGPPVPEKNIVASPRINIDYAEEWATKPLRFSIKGNPHVSDPKPGKQAFSFNNSKGSPSSSSSSSSSST
ncbi:putative 3-methyladenine DNA glycosylase [Balamuthia mandrillaris]